MTLLLFYVLCQNVHLHCYYFTHCHLQREIKFDFLFGTPGICKHSDITLEPAVRVDRYSNRYTDVAGERRIPLDQDPVHHIKYFYAKPRQLSLGDQIINKHTFSQRPFRTLPAISNRVSCICLCLLYSTAHPTSRLRRSRRRQSSRHQSSPRIPTVIDL